MSREYGLFSDFCYSELYVSINEVTCIFFKIKLKLSNHEKNIKMNTSGRQTASTLFFSVWNPKSPTKTEIYLQVRKKTKSTSLFSSYETWT